MHLDNLLLGQKSCMPGSWNMFKLTLNFYKIRMPEEKWLMNAIRFELDSARKSLYNQEVTYVATCYKSYIYYIYEVSRKGPSFWSAPNVPMCPPGGSYF